MYGDPSYHMQVIITGGVLQQRLFISLVKCRLLIEISMVVEVLLCLVFLMKWVAQRCPCGCEGGQSVHERADRDPKRAVFDRVADIGEVRFILSNQLVSLDSPAVFFFPGE